MSLGTTVILVNDIESINVRLSQFTWMTLCRLMLRSEKCA